MKICAYFSLPEELEETIREIGGGSPTVGFEEIIRALFSYEDFFTLFENELTDLLMRLPEPVMMEYSRKATAASKITKKIREVFQQNA